MDKLEKDCILSELQAELSIMSSYSDMISKILNNLDNPRVVQDTALKLAADHLRRMKYLKEKYKTKPTNTRFLGIEIHKLLSTVEL